MALPTGFEPVTFASTVRCSDLAKLRKHWNWWVPEDSNLLTPAPRFHSQRVYNPLRGKGPRYDGSTTAAQECEEVRNSPGLARYRCGHRHQQGAMALAISIVRSGERSRCMSLDISLVLFHNALEIIELLIPRK